MWCRFLVIKWPTFIPPNSQNAGSIRYKLNCTTKVCPANRTWCYRSTRQQFLYMVSETSPRFYHGHGDCRYFVVPKTRTNSLSLLKTTRYADSYQSNLPTGPVNLARNTTRRCRCGGGGNFSGAKRRNHSKTPKSGFVEGSGFTSSRL
jgi:hypothetical protein